jgi:hypothetical protein
MSRPSARISSHSNPNNTCSVHTLCVSGCLRPDVNRSGVFHVGTQCPVFITSSCATAARNTYLAHDDAFCWSLQGATAVSFIAPGDFTATPPHAAISIVVRGFFTATSRHDAVNLVAYGVFITLLQHDA